MLFRSGPMYGQFMLTRNGPKIIEINARFGDPEAMNVIPLLQDSFEDICRSMAEGKMNEMVMFRKSATVCKYVVPEGYGTDPVYGKEIVVDEDGIASEGAKVFYANVDVVNGKLVTGRSRSVGIVGIAGSISEAEEKCERALAHVKSDHIFVRHDIGKEELIQRRIDHMKSL